MLDAKSSKDGKCLYLVSSKYYDQLPDFLSDEVKVSKENTIPVDTHFDCVFDLENQTFNFQTGDLKSFSEKLHHSLEIYSEEGKALNIAVHDKENINDIVCILHKFLGVYIENYNIIGFDDKGREKAVKKNSYYSEGVVFRAFFNGLFSVIDQKLKLIDSQRIVYNIYNLQEKNINDFFDYSLYFILMTCERIGLFKDTDEIFPFMSGVYYSNFVFPNNYKIKTYVDEMDPQVRRNIQKQIKTILPDNAEYLLHHFLRNCSHLNFSEIHDCANEIIKEVNYGFQQLEQKNKAAIRYDIDC